MGAITSPFSPVTNAGRAHNNKRPSDFPNIQTTLCTPCRRTLAYRCCDECRRRHGGCDDCTARHQARRLVRYDIPTRRPACTHNCTPRRT